MSDLSEDGGLGLLAGRCSFSKFGFVMDKVGGGFYRSCVCGGAVGFGLVECGFTEDDVVLGTCGLTGVRGFRFRMMDFVAERRG